MLFAQIRFLGRDDLFKRSHWNMNCEHWTRSELYYSVRCGTKECRVQRTATTHSHDHQVGLCFKGELHDLLVWHRKGQQEPCPYHVTALDTIEMTGAFKLRLLCSRLSFPSA